VHNTFITVTGDDAEEEEDLPRSMSAPNPTAAEGMVGAGGLLRTESRDAAAAGTSIRRGQPDKMPKISEAPETGAVADQDDAEESDSDGGGLARTAAIDHGRADKPAPAEPQPVVKAKGDKGAGKGKGNWEAALPWVPMAGFGYGGGYMLPNIWGDPTWTDAAAHRLWNDPATVTSDAPAAVAPAPSPGLRWHQSATASGDVSECGRIFVKRQFDGRLSLITEGTVRFSGQHRYAVRFTGPEMSMADGVGFVLHKRLPCPRNIQKIHSTFVSRRGYLCSRAGQVVNRQTVGLPPLETGRLIVVTVNLEEQWIEFEVESGFGSMRSARAPLNPHAWPGTPCHGFFCAVVKHEKVGVEFVDA